jgi:predicted metal-dependent peptidase
MSHHAFWYLPVVFVHERMEPHRRVLINGSSVVINTSLPRDDEDAWYRDIAHAVMHIALEHPLSWQGVHDHNRHIACCCMADHMLVQMGIIPKGNRVTIPTDMEVLYAHICTRGIPKGYEDIGTCGSEKDGKNPHLFKRPGEDDDDFKKSSLQTWNGLFARGLREAAACAVRGVPWTPPKVKSGSASADVQGPLAWMQVHYPFFAALVSSYDYVHDINMCRKRNIGVAAVSYLEKKIYLNPIHISTRDQIIFCLAHEILHVCLNHQIRCEWRDPWWWNVACDFAINGWLLEMKVGSPPPVGMLYDASFDGMSAEAIYDALMRDIDAYDDIIGMMGDHGSIDILDHDPHSMATRMDVIREALRRGMELQKSLGRGNLSAGLIESIQGILTDPIPWDVDLGKWFEHHVPLKEKRRSYAVPSRRQGSTPDIPRRGTIRSHEDHASVIGVVLDTSFSMQSDALEKALGSIASYAMARDVDAVRLMHCDADEFDQGYVDPSQLLMPCDVVGRGGTVLQPAIDCLLDDPSFPDDAPILIITDGDTDEWRCPRTHAVVIIGHGVCPMPLTGSLFRIM